MSGMELLRLSVAARRVGVHLGTLRLWANEGEVPVVWVERERRCLISALDALTGAAGSGGRRAAWSVRVSRTGSGREASLAWQGAKLRAAGAVVAVVTDRVLRWRESRSGGGRLPAGKAGSRVGRAAPVSGRVCRAGGGGGG